MEKKFIMTVVGRDRPCIVARVSRIIYESGCNLEDSVMTRLAGEFVMMLLFSGRKELFEDHLMRECRALEANEGIAASFRPIDGSNFGVEEDYIDNILHVEGIDQAGIVYRISSFLAEKNINIVTLRSKLRHSPESGRAIYTMEIGVRIPEGAPLDEIDSGLAQLAGELNIDISRSDKIEACR